MKAILLANVGHVVRSQPIKALIIKGHMLIHLF